MRVATGIRNLALLLALGSAHGAVSHTLLPWKAQAGKAFDLMLPGAYPCNTAFSQESATVATGNPPRIALSFLAMETPAIACATLSQPYGPTFKLPALEAGAYPVYSQALMPCMARPADPCEPRVEPVYVGTLNVTAAAAYDTGWFLHPKRVESGKDARVNLLNLARGSCENGFNPVRDTVRFQITELQFFTAYYKRLCKTSIHPFGPEFHLGELAPGSYRVEGYDLPECAFMKSPCIPLIPYKPVLVDTLVVEAPTTLGPIPERASKSAFRLRRLPGGFGVVGQGNGGKGLALKVERIFTTDGRLLPGGPGP